MSILAQGFKCTRCFPVLPSWICCFVHVDACIHYTPGLCTSLSKKLQSNVAISVHIRQGIKGTEATGRFRILPNFRGGTDYSSHTIFRRQLLRAGPSANTGPPRTRARLPKWEQGEYWFAYLWHAIAHQLQIIRLLRAITSFLASVAIG